jgi:hypothetical protein
MRLIIGLVALVLILLGDPVHAQQQPLVPPAGLPAAGATSSSQSGDRSAQQDKEASRLQVPVSLDKIRGALAQPPAELLKGLNEQPTFRLQVQEQQRFEQLMDKIKFEGGTGPEVAGGRANYELQQVIFPKVDNPLVQPYAAFSTGEVLTLGVEALVEKLVVDKVSHVFGNMLRAQAEREAREEVARNLAALQTAQPAPRSGN